MQICCNCGEVFDDDRIVQTRDRETGWHDYVCTYCGSDEIYEAVQCEICGEWVAEDEIESGFCLECLHNEITYEVAKAYMLTHVGWLSNFVLEFVLPDSDPFCNVSKELDESMSQVFDCQVLLDEFRESKEFLKACRDFCLPDYDQDHFGTEGMQFAEWFKAQQQSK